MTPRSIPIPPYSVSGAVEKYGSVYTPVELADFIARLCWDMMPSRREYAILDPASGELALLEAVERYRPSRSVVSYLGIDIDSHAILASRGAMLYECANLKLFNEDFIMPSNALAGSVAHWKERIGSVDLVISNPPWSSDRRYPINLLKSDGFNLPKGQYDAYLLFIEQSMRILAPGGIAAFILPDSLFSNENTQLRKYLAQTFRIRAIARLGEKFFPEVNRSTAVVVIEKSAPEPSSLCVCFRLDTESRKRVLRGKSNIYAEFVLNSHTVKQSRFSRTENYTFDIDTREHEEALLAKIQSCSFDLSSYFAFGRGVEISKSGVVVVCQFCGCRQGISRSQRLSNHKVCTNCGQRTPTGVTECLLHSGEENGSVPVFVGEDVKRYGLLSGRYLTLDVPGISYKSSSLYSGPKILVRKTGLGIKASLDTSSTLVTQTVYLLKPIDEEVAGHELWYYLALINSRVVFYFYLKIFGENEWKSHPYLTKQTLFQLPLRDLRSVDQQLVLDIAETAKALQATYAREKDLELEEMIFQVYGVEENEREVIRQELLKLPNLSAINEMKF